MALRGVAHNLTKYYSGTQILVHDKTLNTNRKAKWADLDEKPMRYSSTIQLCDWVYQHHDVRNTPTGLDATVVNDH
jgi:hypothetical protein